LLLLRGFPGLGLAGRGLVALGLGLAGRGVGLEAGALLRVLWPLLGRTGGGVGCVIS